LMNWFSPFTMTIWRGIGFAVLLTLAAAFANPQSVSGHAAFERSDPPPNAVLAGSPSEILIWFTEPLEYAYSSAELYDQSGEVIEGIESEPGDSPNSLRVVVPETLTNGTYSVAWRNLSALDGHTMEGYFTFTIGSQADVITVAGPVVEDGGGPPLWLRAASRWLVLLGLAVVIAAWPLWLLIVRPAVGESSGLSELLAKRVRTLAFIALAFTLVANLIALMVQGATLTGGSLAERVWNTLTDTRYGELWIFRIALLAAMGLALTLVSWQRPLNQRARTALVLGVTLVLPLPLSLNSHAAAVGEGRTAAIAFDYVHALAASIWFGGLIVLLGVLLRSLGGESETGRRGVLAMVLPRFSGMALVCWGMLVITGVYASWLHVGSLEALRETPYGRSLSLKIALLAVVLVIAAFNLLFITRRLLSSRPSNGDGRWMRRLSYAVSAEVVLTIIVLFAVGRMTSQQPARDALVTEVAGITIAVDLEGQPATLSLAPGAAGPNHYQLTVEGDLLPEETQALLRLDHATQSLGMREITLDRSSGNIFEGHGSEFGISGDWDVEVIVRLIGSFNWNGETEFAIESSAAQAGTAQPAWRFTTEAIAGLALVLLGLFGLVMAWLAGPTRLRTESASLALVALALGGFLFVQGRLQPAAAGIDYSLTNPVLATDESVARGEAIYSANCLVCHGAAGRGDGPGGAGMVPMPADFTAPHAKAHVDGELFTWVRDGKPGTGMPAFGETLSDEEIWDVINYIETEFQEEAIVDREGTPVAE
jgi:copper transport protein